MRPAQLFAVVTVASFRTCYIHGYVHQKGLEQDSLSLATREHWMRQAYQALHDLISPCPFEAFGTVIVNHTRLDELGDLICIGANHIATGNPTKHGEIAGIDNCTAVLTDPEGRFKLSPVQTKNAFRDLTLYTTAEPCPMCSAAIRWANFKECVFGTSVPTLSELGWPQMQIRASEVFERSSAVGSDTILVSDVLRNETDPYFSWQFKHEKSCPNGCIREGHLGRCTPKDEKDIRLELK